MVLDLNPNNLTHCCYRCNFGELYYLDSSFFSTETIVFLHGFTGSSRDFFTIPDDIKKNYRCLIPDLPGHGQTHLLEVASVFQSAGQVTLLEQWLDSLEVREFHLFGYSMGGRLALQFAVKNSHRLKSIILVSTTAGIKEESVRKARLKVDEKLAEKILTSSHIDFLKSWLLQPLFHGIIAKGDDFVVKEIERRLPIQLSGLASSLKYFSSGIMPSVWHNLSQLKIPALVIAGAKDAKYVKIASDLVTLIPHSKLKLIDTSHAPLIESPVMLWQQVTAFLSELKIKNDASGE